MRLRVVETGQALAALEGEWRCAYTESDCDNPFLSWDWVWRWWTHFGDQHRLLVLVVEDARGIAGLAPLAVTASRAGILSRPVVHFVGDDLLADYSDFLIVRDAESVVAAIIAWLRTQPSWGRLDLRRVPETSRALGGFRAAMTAGRIRVCLAVECRSPYAAIDGDWDQYAATRSKALRQELRTTANRLGRLGEPRWETVEGSRREARETLYALHRRRHARKVGRSLFEAERTRAFFDDLTETAASGWRTELSLLRLDGRIISVVLALRTNATFYYWVPTFDDELRTGSIGKLHLQHLLEQSVAEKCARFDLMIGEEAYKLEWATAVAANWRITLYRDQFAAAADRVVASMENVARHLRGRSRLAQRLWLRFSKSALRERTHAG